MIKLFIYAFSLILSIFAINGIDLNPLIKKGHVHEARFLYLLLIVSFTYLVANFIIDIMSIKLI